MQDLRRLVFFDRRVVKEEGAGDIQSLNVSVACGGPDHLWCGDKAGGVRRLDRDYSLSPTVQLFDRELADLKTFQEGKRLVALGADSPGPPGTALYKIFDTRSEEPRRLVANRVFPARGQESRAICFDASPSLDLLAVGVGTGAVHLFRGRDLTQDKPPPTILGEEGDPPVTSLHVLRQERRTVLFACSTLSVRSWGFQEGEAEVRLLSVDTTGGAGEACACLFPSINALLVARGDGIVAFDADEGRRAEMALDGAKVILTQFKSYLVSVTSVDVGLGAGSAGGGGFAAAASSSGSLSMMPRQNILVCLTYPPHMRFIAFQSQFTDVTHVVAAMGRVFVISRAGGGGEGGSTALYELQEKELSEQVKILLKKRMFEWAAEIARERGAPVETAVEIYRQHGDALFEKRAYDQALAVYTKTVDLGVPLEPSYVVEKYLDAQRIGHVAKYLQRLHERSLAEREHTALLLKCYTKLKDFSTLEEFLSNTPTSQYDATTAIEVLEGAGYYGLAAAIAQMAPRHEDYVRISLEHFKSYSKTVNFLRTLPRAEASQILSVHGRMLMRHEPLDTVRLLRELCGITAGGGPPIEGEAGGLPLVETFLPIFVDEPKELEHFLRSLLLAPGGCCLPPAQAQRLCPTLLELMVRSHRGLVAQGEAGAGEEALQAQRLHGEIMRLVRQYTSEEAMVSTLLLCQTYGFVDGFFHAAERLGRFQLLMSWCFEQRDSRRLLEVCKRCGSVDQSLWVQALTFLAEDPGDHVEEIGEVLRHIEESDLLPLLLVIETLQRNPSTKLGTVRSYLQGQFRKLVESVESSRQKARQDRQEIARMQQEILALRTQAQEFQNTRCSLCSLSLEVPAIHFFCQHSYHADCVREDEGCPKCASEALPKVSLLERREAQARNTEGFFKELQQGGGGEAAVLAAGEWCRLGAFDATAAGQAAAAGLDASARGDCG